MWFLSLAKTRHKFFLAQFWFGTKIKTFLKSIPQNTKILNLTEKGRSQQPIPVLGPRQKWVKFPPTFFKLSINFLVDYHLLSNILKIWMTLFWFWQIITHFTFWHGQKSKILTWTIKAKMIIFEKYLICVLWKKSIF